MTQWQPTLIIREELQAAAAEILATAAKTLEFWRCKGKGPKYVKLGRSVRYRESDLNEYIKALEPAHDLPPLPPPPPPVLPGGVRGDERDFQPDGRAVPLLQWREQQEEEVNEKVDYGDDVGGLHLFAIWLH